MVAGPCPGHHVFLAPHLEAGIAGDEHGDDTVGMHRALPKSAPAGTTPWLLIRRSTRVKAKDSRSHNWIKDRQAASFPCPQGKFAGIVHGSGPESPMCMLC
jgi:hypothetical protein